MGGRPVSRWDAQGLAGPPPCPPPTGEYSRKCLQNGPCVNFPGTTLDSIILTGSASGSLGNSWVWGFFVCVYLQSVVTHHWLFQGLCSSTVDVISLENEV